jgi:hypothetical protein
MVGYFGQYGLIDLHGQLLGALIVETVVLIFLVEHFDFDYI